jgi:hypothetical protein
MHALLLSLASTGALAQNPADWQFSASPVLAPNPGIAFASSTISNPSVVWDSGRSRYLMFFESRTQTVNAACPQGVWSVGMATSPDGVSWTMLSTQAVPGGTSYFSCVAAHPTAIYRRAFNERNSNVYVYFKAEQRNNVSCARPPSWGCQVNPGIGLATMCFDASGNPYRCGTARTPVIPNTTANAMATPHVTQQDGAFRIAFAQTRNIYEATNTAFNTVFTVNPTPVLDRAALFATIPWLDDEFFNPSAVCGDDLSGNQDLALFVGGRDNNFGSTVTGGWGKAVSDRTVVSYVLDATPQQEWTGNNEWRHWEVRKLTNADGEYVVYYDERDGSGNNSIYLGMTDPSLSWSSADFGGSVCQ